MLDFLKNISPTELAIIVLILVVLFGAKLMTGFAKTSGESFKELKKIKKEFTGLFDDNKSSKS
jgi:Sec-independent protein translocase protein TatA